MDSVRETSEVRADSDVSARRSAVKMLKQAGPVEPQKLAKQGPWRLREPTTGPDSARNVGGAVRIRR